MIQLLVLILVGWLALPMESPSSKQAGPLTFTLSYQPYAFIDIVPASNDVDPISRFLSEHIAMGSHVDVDDLQTQLLLKSEPDKVHHSGIQYVDNSGAKITVLDLKPAFAPVTKNMLSIALGYGSYGVSSEVVLGKVDQLMQLAEAACSAAGVSCSITKRIVEQTSPAP